MKDQMLLNEVAIELGLLPYQIAYELTCRRIPEPTQRINNKRIFTRKDVDGIKKYFAGKAATKKEANGK